MSSVRILVRIFADPQNAARQNGLHLQRPGQANQIVDARDIEPMNHDVEREREAEFRDDPGHRDFLFMDRRARDEMEQKSGGRQTVPQIFIGETHVGGCDDLYALDDAGGLDPLLAGSVKATG